jgi:hypothetical protein
MAEDSEGPRQCGPCSYCCKLPDIEEMDSPAGETCRNVKPGGGCKIYDTRPATCRAFLCQWMLKPALPHGFRPDLCGVMLSSAGSEEQPCLLAACDLADPDAWRREPMYGFLKHQSRSQWPRLAVMATVGRRYWLITPDEDCDLGELPQGYQIQVDQFPDGRADVRMTRGGG